MSLALVLAPASPPASVPPHGAAELKRLHPAYFRRALVVSCAGALSCAFVLRAALQSSTPPPRRPVVITIREHDHPIPPAPGRIPPRTPRPSKSGVFHPSTDIDSVAAPDPLTEPVFTGSLAGGDATSGAPTGASEGADFDRLPPIDSFVYHEDEPIAITRVEPPYPEIAKQAGIEGTVVLRVLVDRQGRVRDVRVVRSQSVFEDPSVDAVRRWVFRPALSQGRPVAVWVAITIRFRLH